MCGSNVIEIANHRFYKALDMIDLDLLELRGYAYDDSAPVYALGSTNIEMIAKAGYSDLLPLVMEKWRDYYGFK